MEQKEVIRSKLSLRPRKRRPKPKQSKMTQKLLKKLNKKLKPRKRNLLLKVKRVRKVAQVVLLLN
jgi:hypothetical protein